jgi:ribosomal protein L28
MMDTIVSKTCRAAKSEIKFYDFKTNVHLVGFYSLLSLMMHGTINVRISAKCLRFLNEMYKKKA